MSWVAYALIGPLIFTVINFIDKLLLEKEIPDPLMMPIVLTITALLSGTLLHIVTGFPTLPLPALLITVFSGVLTTGAAAFYFVALSREHTSNVIVLLKIEPVMTLILSYLFLRETITASQLLGFVLLLSAALALSANRETGRIRPSTSLWLVMMANLSNAAAQIVFKHVAESYPFEQIISFETYGFAVGGMVVYLLVPPIRRAFNNNIRQISRRAMGLLGFAEGIFIISKVCIYLAITLGPVALVSVLGSTGVLYGVVLGWILTVIAPSIYRERFTRDDLIWKASFSLVLIAGVWFINTSAHTG
jgi:transporter family protein